jgi:Protein of unknown function (DUF2795)
MVSPIDLQKALGGMEYPAGKDAIVEHAKAHGGGEDVVSALEGLGDGEFDTPAAVSKAVFD